MMTATRSKRTPILISVLLLLWCGLEAGAQIQVPRGRPQLNAARTTFVADNGQLLRGPYESTEWTSAAPEANIANIKTLGFNAVHLYAEVFDPNYPNPGSNTPGYAVVEVDKMVEMTRDLGLYLVMTIGNGANNGNHNYDYAIDFWEFYAPRYADETHVVYEIHNEPMAWGPSYLTGTTPADTMAMEIAAYNTIRSHAPDTPVLLFSYAVLGGNGGANAALSDIEHFNQEVFGTPSAVWTNEAVGFHGYAGADGAAVAVSDLIAAGYPCFMTEFATGTWGGDRGGLDVEAVANLERAGVSWLTFQYIPPSGVSDDITRPDAYVDRVNNSGLSWTPDYGSWPIARSVFGNGGLPRATPDYVSNTLSGSVRIESEDFDEGGKGVAYFNGNASNPGGVYRTDETVGIEATLDAGGGHNIAWTAAGDWLEYTIKVNHAGTYDLRARVAGASPGRVQVALGGEDITGEWTLPSTGGGQTWTTVSRSVFLKPGQQILRVNVLSGGFSLNWLELSVEPAGPVPDGTYKFLNAASVQAMDLNAGNEVIVGDYTGAADEQWGLVHIGGGQYRVNSVGAGESWTTFAGGLHLGPWWGASGDRCFVFRPTGGGFYQIFSAGGGRPLQPSSGNPPFLDEVAATGATEQKWGVVVPAAPAFPVNLVAEELGSTTAGLTWDAVSGATSYNIKRAAVSGGPYATIVSGITTTSHTDTGLAEGVQYFYVVSAVAGGVESLDSTEAVLGISQLAGAIIGTPGSYNNLGNTIDKVFDGNLATFSDGPNASGGNGCWVGLDFGAGVGNVIAEIKYAPRSGFEGRMVNGIFQGANEPDFSDAVALMVVGQAPPANVFTSVEINEPTGFRYVRFLSPDGGWGNVAELEFHGYSAATLEQAAYGGVPWPIPGVVEAEDFDTGGPGVAYSDADVPNVGGSYRGAESVDIEVTGDIAGGGYNVGWTAADEWLEYTVDVAAAGSYDISLRVASGAGWSDNTRMHVEFDGVDVTGLITGPADTGGWHEYTDLTVSGVMLDAGQQVMRVYIDGADFNLNWIEVSVTPGPLPATVELGDLTATYNGSPKPVTATTNPPDLAVAITYDGSAAPPTDPGTYAVSADITDPDYFGSTTGFLVIAPRNYGDWEDSSFSPAQIAAGDSDPEADPDLDGWKNLAEYALGMDPWIFNPPLPTERTSSEISITFQRPAHIGDVTYLGEASADLQSWEVLPTVVLNPGSDPETVKVTKSWSAPGPGRQYLRVKFVR